MKTISKQKYIHDQVKPYNETIVNIVHNYIPYKCITCNDKHPAWLNYQIKHLINTKNEIFKKYLKDKRPNSLYEKLQTITWDLTIAIHTSKHAYYKCLDNKLNDPTTSSKAYWSTIRTIDKGKKIPAIPPIIVNKKLVTNFKDKANIFKDFFSKQREPIPNNSILLSIQTFETFNRLSTVDIALKKILKLIQGLTCTKANGHDNIFIRMLKICGTSIIKPLFVI